jgi:glucose/arabinose dehydrogenase
MSSPALTLRSTLALAALAGAAVLSTAAPLAAQTVRTVPVATGLSRPVFVTHAPGDRSRLFIVEQRGSGGISTRGDIRILDLATNTVLPTPFLSITGLTTASEQGLLSMVFAPDYATSGRFYVNYTTSGGTTTIARYTVSSNPNVANPASIQVLLTIPQFANNHNGGWMGFGPDGYLYIATGDGGGSGDPQNNGQNLNSLLGKMLRLDVSGPGAYVVPPTNPFATGGGRAEIWAWGLRNPWRSSFDRLTGDLWIADVGQNAWEEVNFQPAIGNPPYTAVNYGWRCFEGNAVFSTASPCPPANHRLPVHVYPIAGQPECAITGGYVYRGCAMPGERGNYFFADYCSAKIWSFRRVNGVVTDLRNRTAELQPAPGSSPASITWISSFGEDADGELYVVSHLGGAVFKMVPRCWANCDGSTTAPVLNVEDFTCFINRFALNDCWANCDGSTVDPILNVEDFTCFINQFALGCP